MTLPPSAPRAERPTRPALVEERTRILGWLSNAVTLGYWGSAARAWVALVEITPELHPFFDGTLTPDLGEDLAQEIASGGFSGHVRVTTGDRSAAPLSDDNAQAGEQS